MIILEIYVKGSLVSCLQSQHLGDREKGKSRVQEGNQEEKGRWMLVIKTQRLYKWNPNKS